jgi:hypothetical protein
MDQAEDRGRSPPLTADLAQQPVSNPTPTTTRCAAKRLDRLGRDERARSTVTLSVPNRVSVRPDRRLRVVAVGLPPVRQAQVVDELIVRGRGHNGSETWRSKAADH